MATRKLSAAVKAPQVTAKAASPAPARKAAPKKVAVKAALAEKAVSAAPQAVVVVPAKKAVVTKKAVLVKPAKVKPKLVRDSFTMPKAEYLAIDVLKQRAAQLARPVKKSELLRAGVKLLSALNDKALLAAMNDVPTIKTGRPGKG
jgi:hypothetical protein